MGYYSTLYGKLDVTVKPVFNYSKELRDLAAQEGVLLPAGPSFENLSRKISEDGLLSYWFQGSDAGQIVPISEPHTLHDFPELMEALVSLLDANGFSGDGEFICAGDDIADVSRVRVVAGKALEAETVKMVWPDGTEFISPKY